MIVIGFYSHTLRSCHCSGVYREERRPLLSHLLPQIFSMASNVGNQHPPVGSQIASKTGAVQYEDEPGQSLSGGVQSTGGSSIHNPVNGSGAGPQQFQGTFEAKNFGTSKPHATELNTAGQSNASSSYPQGTATQNKSTSDTLYDQAARGAQVAATKAQELAEPIQPYVQKVQESVGPYVQTAIDNASPYVQQAREAASPYVEKASTLASQGIQATAAELDKRGVNMDTIQQKTADVSQTLKDYGTVGQARAGEYFQQAVDQASTLRSDSENRNIFATVFGTIALIWLAFGFSITALLALGIAGGLAAILSRYSRAAVGLRSQPTINSSQVRDYPGVETHTPNPSHPDASINN